MSEIPFCSCNLDMGVSYTPIFLSETLCTRLLILDFNRLCGIETEFNKVLAHEYGAILDSLLLSVAVVQNSLIFSF